LDVRPVVANGDDVPYRVRLAGRGPRSGWWSRVALLSKQIDNDAPLREGGSIGSGSFSGGSSLGSSLKVRAAGKHRLKLSVQLAAAAGPSPTDPDKTPPRWTRQILFTRPFEVLPVGAPSPVWWTEDTSLATAIRQAIGLHGVRASGNRFGAFEMTVRVENAPVNLAFDIFARAADGKEHRIGSVTAFAGTRHNVGVNAEIFPPGPNVGKVDVIFRSSEAVLKGTTDMYEAWRGEVVFRDVVVTPGKY
jgi:hypothetical protein